MFQQHLEIPRINEQSKTILKEFQFCLLVLFILFSCGKGTRVCIVDPFSNQIVGDRYVKTSMENQ